MDGAGAERGKDMNEEDDYEYYRRMFRSSLWWSVALVARYSSKIDTAKNIRWYPRPDNWPERSKT